MFFACARDAAPRHRGSPRSRLRPFKLRRSVTMKIARRGAAVRLGLLTAALASAHPLAAQTTKMPSTLRYGSGYIDVPVASVLPHLAVTGTFSGFRVSVDRI